MGLAAWIIEKFRAWSDCNGDVETAFTRDRLLANISFYWFTGAIGSSFWPYYARMHRPWPIPDGQTVDVAISVARQVITSELDQKRGAALIDRAIADLPRQLGNSAGARS